MYEFVIGVICSTDWERNKCLYMYDPFKNIRQAAAKRCS